MKKALLTIGSILLVFGIGLLSWVGWQFYGTNWASAKAQKQAVAQLDKDWKNATPENRASMRPDKAKSGQAFATIKIIVNTIDFHYVYKVDSDPRKLQVKFTDTWVLDRQPINPKPKGMDTPRYDRNQLITLTTCAELFHTDLRTVVFGSLESTKPRFGPSTDLPEPIFPQQPMTPNPPLPNPSKK